MDDLISIANNESVLAIAIAILSWIAKNHFVAYLLRREEAARKEWEFRLLNVWNPLFFWSGVVLFEPSKKDADDPKNSYGIKELSGVLEKAAHLLPPEHYYAFIKVLELRTKQKKVEMDLTRLKTARAFVYGQIETYNYILFGRHPWFKPTRITDPVGSIREFARWFAELAWHVLIWGSLALVLMAIVIAITEGRLPVVLTFGALGLLLLTMYIYWRFRAHRALTIR